MSEPTLYEVMQAIDRVEGLVKSVVRDVNAIEIRLDRDEYDIGEAEREIVKLNRDVVAIETALNNLSNRR